MKLYGGIDPHSNSSVVALLDADDQVVYRQRLSNDAAEIVAALAPFRRPRWERRPSHSIHVRSARKRKMANAWCEMESGHAPFSSPLTPHPSPAVVGAERFYRDPRQGGPLPLHGVVD